MTRFRDVLKDKNFFFLWLGQVVSEVGDWLNAVAVLAMTIEFAGPARAGVAVAIYAVARHLPIFLFGPIAGVLVDRWNRRSVMIVADIVRALLALGFVVAAQRKSLAAIYVVGAALFCVAAFFNAAKRASIPRLVSGTNALLSANSLTASTTATTLAVGSALGGMLVSVTGRDAVFITNAFSFLLYRGNPSMRLFNRHTLGTRAKRRFE